ncbi:hypothetical protein CCUS01_09862 [Colletotrichum cuscutae]|uniref:Uncharacterized protein n=1 Tax=Colletotrichum cuscutae TaxID=1209917 RepID=A0AAI9UEL7_9PEZI|nr:hypothetical protein CCUS01_09862 [Colletotrichum cuscutae]
MCPPPSETFRGSIPKDNGKEIREKEKKKKKGAKDTQAYHPRQAGHFRFGTYSRLPTRVHPSNRTSTLASTSRRIPQSPRTTRRIPRPSSGFILPSLLPFLVPTSSPHSTSALLPLPSQPPLPSTPPKEHSLHHNPKKQDYKRRRGGNNQTRSNIASDSIDQDPSAKKTTPTMFTPLLLAQKPHLPLPSPSLPWPFTSIPSMASYPYAHPFISKDEASPTYSPSYLPSITYHTHRQADAQIDEIHRRN